ncbi:MAG: TIGR00341 family protein [Verrucomicrobiota bacterium]
MPTESKWQRLFPHLERADRLALVDNLKEASQWSMNFGVMLGCSVIIAGFGLIQDSVAVIIGAMLVAPLMTPLIGTGLALVQGNFKLLADASRAMIFGSLLSLALGILLRLLTPGHELTMQVAVRGSPNILDLGIAFFAGVAAGYAMARPKMSGALPGVAISVALVPPLAAAGIALGSADWAIALGALLLFATNMVAIVLGSALVFRIHGIKTPKKNRTAAVSMKRIILALGFALVIMTAPLAYRLMDQIRQGQAKPNSLALSEKMWTQLDKRLEREPGIDFLAGARASSEGPEDVTLVITADRTVPGTLILEIDNMIDNELGRDIEVKINVIQQGAVSPMPNTVTKKSPGDPAPTVNE